LDTLKNYNFEKDRAMSINLPQVYIRYYWNKLQFIAEESSEEAIFQGSLLFKMTVATS